MTSFNDNDDIKINEINPIFNKITNISVKNHNTQMKQIFFKYQVFLKAIKYNEFNPIKNDYFGDYPFIRYLLNKLEEIDTVMRNQTNITDKLYFKFIELDLILSNFNKWCPIYSNEEYQSERLYGKMLGVNYSKIFMNNCDYHNRNSIIHIIKDIVNLLQDHETKNNPITFKCYLCNQTIHDDQDSIVCSNNCTSHLSCMGLKIYDNKDNNYDSESDDDIDWLELSRKPISDEYVNIEEMDAHKEFDRKRIDDLFRTYK